MKILKKIIAAVLFLALLSPITFYLWLTQRWKSTMDEEEFKSLVTSIDTAPNLPERFYKIYSLVYGYDETTTTFWTLLKRPWYDRTCPCMEVNYGWVTDGYDRWSVGLELERYVTPKKCFDAYLNKIPFLKVKGIENASNFYFKKELSELSDDEMLSLAIISLSPRYDPTRDPKLLKEKLEKYKQVE